MTQSAAELTSIPASMAPAFSWVRNGAAAKVMAALNAESPAAARFVGGCVRDSLFDITPKDIDIATQLTPDRVTEALRAAGLGVAPTGIEHGTVTGIADHQGVEITTLRADVSTDGRRATVAFTKDWAEDAARRDFTMNALYLTAELQLFDPVGGLADARASQVRFIGDPDRRIREDYLRILRFFRFSARFADAFDEAGRDACARLKEGMSVLSAERVGDELEKILALPTAERAVAEMIASGVLRQVWNVEPNLATFRNLKAMAPDAPPPLGLAALYDAEDCDVNGQSIDRTLRLSNAHGARRKAVVANAKRLSSGMDLASMRVALYQIGTERWDDAVLLAAARGQLDDTQLRAFRDLPERWTPPVFPIGGRDVLAAGVAKGPMVAKILDETERRWMDEGFPDGARALEILQSILSDHPH